MKLKELDLFFKKTLNLDWASQFDKAINGLQVGDYNREINKIAFAVDASLESIKAAAELKADLLFVHHGLFWGEQFPIVNSNYNRIAELVQNGIALYATHIPLDMHETLGNNIQIAKLLKLSKIEQFGFYKGAKIGFKGNLKTSKNIDEILSIFGKDRKSILSVLDFGRTKIKSVGIISGGATFDVAEAIEDNLDLYITGDCAHEVYHTCKEANINMLSLGHYFSETFGVQAVKKYVEKKLKIETVFIDIDTKL